MRQSKFPEGWSGERVRRVLAHYEEQTEEETVAEDEAGVESSETVMSVPHELVPVIREIIAKRRRSA
jgi:type II secretory pathway component PulC